MLTVPIRNRTANHGFYAMRALVKGCILASSMGLGAFAQPSGKPLKWACIGNSITQGYNVTATDAYPVKLGKLLGPGFVIENDGVSGTTLLKAGDSPYWTKGKLSNVFAFKPDIITIKLGTNDSKPANWDGHKGEFERDYLALIDTLSAMPQKPRILICIPVPAFSDASGSLGIRGSVIKNEIIPLVKKVASERNLATIDLYTPLQNSKSLFPDDVHPNAAGHDSIANIVFRTFLANSTRLACIGNSITQYTAQANTDPKDAYPVKLNEMLGANWYAVNQGWSGAYMQKVSPQPYWNSTRLRDVIAFKPNVVTIKLGTNDSRQQDWHADKFIADYKSMIDSLNTLDPKPKIWLLTPIPSWPVGGSWPFNGINDSIIRLQTIPAVKQVAAAKGLDVIDLYTPMSNQKRLVPDGVHPNAEGQDSLAHYIYRALSAPVTALGPIPARKATWPEIAIREGSVWISIPDGGDATAGIFSADGREIASIVLKKGTPGIIPLSRLSKGRFILTVESPATGLRAAKVLIF